MEKRNDMEIKEVGYGYGRVLERIEKPPPQKKENKSPKTLEDSIEIDNMEVIFGDNG